MNNSVKIIAEYEQGGEKNDLILNLWILLKFRSEPSADSLGIIGKNYVS